MHPHPRRGIDSTSNRALPLQSFPRTSAEVRAYATRFGSPYFPRLSLWCSEIVVSDVAHYNSCDGRRSLRSLLTSSAGKISSQREWIDLVPSRKAYFRQYPYQEERKSTKCKWTAVLCGGTHLWPQKPKKLTKTQKKKSTFDQIYKVDEHYKSDDLSVWRFLWIQTTTQAFKEKNEKVSLTSPFLTPAARCGECRFKSTNTSPVQKRDAYEAIMRINKEQMKEDRK